MPPGKPELIELIREEIRQNGPISFARFMQRALYHPAHGFYSSGRARLGRDGDYFTNVSIGPAYGQLLSSQFVEAWKLLGEPEDFVIVEQGAHDGEFARDVLHRIGHEHPKLFGTLRYRIVEPSPVLLRKQAKTLAKFKSQVEWEESLESLEPFQGIHFSNELIDAFPVRLIARADVPSRWVERRVSLDQDDFAFVNREITDPEFLERINGLPARDAPYTTEINLEALRWIHEAASKLRRGFLVAVDYGLSRADYYAENRNAGTLQVRRDHRLLDSPLADIGDADLTSHVDWTSLIEEAQRAGFTLQGLADQHHFLTGILANDPDFLASAAAKIRRELQTLLHPEMLGRSFQVLVLGRGIPSSAKLSGLRFRQRTDAVMPAE